MYDTHGAFFPSLCENAAEAVPSTPHSCPPTLSYSLQSRQRHPTPNPGYNPSTKRTVCQNHYVWYSYLYFAVFFMWGIRGARWCVPRIWLECIGSVQFFSFMSRPVANLHPFIFHPTLRCGWVCFWIPPRPRCVCQGAGTSARGSLAVVGFPLSPTEHPAVYVGAHITRQCDL